MDRLRRLDRAAAMATTILVAVLAIVAAGRLAEFRPETSMRDPHGIRGYIALYSSVLMLVWCTASVPLVVGLFLCQRWAIWGTLALNALYLLPSIVGVGWFGIAMHAVLFGYGVFRVRRSKTEGRPHA